MYIVLEWVVGTGKSTQAKKLADYLSIKYPGREILLTREPGGTEIAEVIRTLVQATEFESEEMSPLTDIYLYASARAQLIESLVKPALHRDAIVISDRNFCSSLAIQGVAQGMWLEKVWHINKEAVEDVMPDVVLFLDLDVDIWLQRTFDADGDKFEKRKAEFSHKIYAWYQKLFDFEPTKHLMQRVDASGTVDEVFERIVHKIDLLKE